LEKALGTNHGEGDPLYAETDPCMVRDTLYSPPIEYIMYCRSKYGPSSLLYHIYSMPMIAVRSWLF